MLNGMLPNYATMIAVLMVITCFPQIAGVIPRSFGFKVQALLPAGAEEPRGGSHEESRDVRRDHAEAQGARP